VVDQAMIVPPDSSTRGTAATSSAWLREIYGFEGSPIVLNMRVREKRKR
jgi:hypothetical protein